MSLLLTITITTKRPLRKREPVPNPHDLHVLRGFYLPQRDHVKQPMPARPPKEE